MDRNGNRPHLTPRASPKQAESFKNAPEIISEPLTFPPTVSTRHKSPNPKSTTHSHPPELSPRSVHNLPHNIISLYFLYLCKNSRVSLRYLRQLKLDNFNKSFSLREFLHNTPEEHKKVSSSVLQKGHEIIQCKIGANYPIDSYSNCPIEIKENCRDWRIQLGCIDLLFCPVK